MTSINFEPDYWWLEGGFSSNVQIVGNTIVNGGGRAISVEVKPGAGGWALAGAHNNIEIKDNTMTNVAEEPYRLTSIDGLILSGNTFGSISPVITNCVNVQNFD